MIVLELQKYWKRFRAFLYIFVSALRLTYTGSYRIIQRCFSERTSRLRGYFKNVQLRLFIGLVWSSGDVSLVYESSGREAFSLKLALHFLVGPTPLPCVKPALGLFLSFLCCPLTPHQLSPLSHSLTWVSLWSCRHPPPPEHHLPPPTYPTSRGGLGDHHRTTLAPPLPPEAAPSPAKPPLSRL